VSRELLSTSRPTTLRLAGFLTLAVGGALLGFGAVAEWARFEGFDAPTSGIDVWEGFVALSAAFVTLIGLLAMRLVGPGVARAIAVLVVVGGLAAAALAGADALRARTRFTDPGQRDRIARELAASSGLPVDPLREAIEEQFQGTFSVTLGPGIFLTIAGGALCVAGGVLSWRWIALVEAREAATSGADETLDDDEPAS
jgi:hypothetical protein